MIYIAFGSNLGNRLNNLQNAVSLIKERCITDLQCSIIIETDAITLKDAPQEYNKPFLNMVGCGTSALSPHELLNKLKNIELRLGRSETYDEWSPRIIDIDILLYNNEIINTPNLIIPHKELDNRPFLKHLLYMLEAKNTIAESFKASSNSMVISPKLVGIVNVTPDSFSDGGKYLDSSCAIEKSIELSQDGASIIELGAQSTRPNARIIGADHELKFLTPILESLKESNIKISIDTFHDKVVNNIINKYNVSWINDVKGELKPATLRNIAGSACSIAVMHSLDVPARKDRCIDDNTPPITTIIKWAEVKIEYLMKYGFDLKQIILDPGIGFSKSSYQDMLLLQDTHLLKKFGCKILIGHSRKSFIANFSNAPAPERDIETIALSAILKDKADYLRVHNVKDHMRFFVTQAALNGF